MTPPTATGGGGKGNRKDRGPVWAEVPRRRRVAPGRDRGERGSAFFIVTVLAVTATVLIGAYLSTSLSKVRHVEKEVRESSAFNAAESGLNTAIHEVWAFYRAQDPTTRVSALDALDGNGVDADRFRIADRVFGRSVFRVEVTAVNVVGTDYADVEFRARGRNATGSSVLTAVVRYGHEPSAVFDHGYFINNFGWLWGAGVTVNGSVRSNGNFSCRNATVNGDLYAAENPELGAAGTIEGSWRSDTVDWYNSHFGDRARPTNPTAPNEDANGNGVLDAGEDANGNGILDEYPLVDGYDGLPAERSGLAPIEMPYLGDLTIYRNLATEKGGTIRQGGTLVVDAVLGDQAGEDENLILVGTADNPIVIDGPVVIESDIVLKGVITGQGTIYAGRNVHIIGDLTYANPPSWPKPLTDVEAVRAQNEAADIVGFAARGSVILGDYTVQAWETTTRSYQKPPFTAPYRVDAADADIGYVSYFDGDGNPVFDGDYTKEDGGTKGVDTGVLEARRYFESSFSDALVHSLADEQVKHVDGVLYTNHLLSGKVGATTFNGTLVSRDEAIIYNGSLDINYDIRVSQGEYEFLDSFLPRVPAHRLLYWREAN